MDDDNLTTLRICRHCNVEKPLSEFQKTRGKYFWKCKACAVAVNQQWINRNRDKVRGIKTAYRDRHPERNAKAKRKWAAAHEGQAREWKRNHRDRVNEMARAAYARNPGSVLERIEKYAAKYPERVKQFKRDAARIGSARRRTAEGNFTPRDVKRIYEQQRGRCADPDCRKSLKRGYHIDHIMPVSKGGTNWPENLQLLCPTCNLRKRDKTPDEWARFNGRLF